MDPSFHRTVVLICAHGEEGTLGLVLNRALPLPVSDVLEGWEPRICAPPRVFQGGPVAVDQAMALGRRSTPGAAAVPAWTPVTDRIGIVSLSGTAADLAPDIDAVRVFAGHAGWGRGQLAAELAQEAWWVVDSHPDDAFSGVPDSLWRAVLRRQPWELAMFASFPPDPLLN